MPNRTIAPRGPLFAKGDIAAGALFGVALLLILAIAGWGTHVDLREAYNGVLQAETGHLRSQAIRTVGKIEERMGAPDATLSAVVQDHGWLRQAWDGRVPSEQRLYAAVVDRSGAIVIHSDPAREGRSLGSGWYERKLDEAGQDVVETASRYLTTEPGAIDVRIPIYFHDKVVGTYHNGLSPAWFKQRLAERTKWTWVRWGTIAGVMLLVVLLTGVSFYRIINSSAQLRQAVESARLQRFAGLGELAAGIAHEIRNPINAIRLNLHSLQRLQQIGTPQGNIESIAVVAETNREIERLEGLIKIMLGYARPDKPVNEDLEIHAALEGAVAFLKSVMDRDGVTVRTMLTAGPLYVHIDRDRFRQIMLNLLNNAKEAVGAGGHIDVSLRRDHDTVEVVVADDGPGVAPADRERIFDPFYSTKELGTGLGLALVKRFVGEAGGSVVCESNNGSGACFRLTFAEVVAGPPPGTFL